MSVHDKIKLFESKCQKVSYTASVSRPSHLSKSFSCRSFRSSTQFSSPDTIEALESSTSHGTPLSGKAKKQQSLVLPQRQSFRLSKQFSSHDAIEALESSTSHGIPLSGKGKKQQSLLLPKCQSFRLSNQISSHDTIEALESSTSYGIQLSGKDKKKQNLLIPQSPISTMDHPMFKATIQTSPEQNLEMHTAITRLSSSKIEQKKELVDGDSQVRRNREPVLTIDDLVFHSMIGEGQFGRVWRTSSRKHQISDSNSLIAVKVISKNTLIEGGSFDGVITNLKREIEILRELKNDQCPHPCIVELIEALQDEHSIYIAQEYCSAGDLFQLIHEDKAPFLKCVTKFYAACIIDALNHLHVRGILYRDLKPENIVIRQDTGYPVLIDFGYAKHFNPNGNTEHSSTTFSRFDSAKSKKNPSKGFRNSNNDFSMDIATLFKAEKKRSQDFADDADTTMYSSMCSEHFVSETFVGDDDDDDYYGSSQLYTDFSESERVSEENELRCFSMVGTLKYVAPEIILGTGYDYRADLWSYGVVLYEMLAGYNPMEGPYFRDELCDTELIHCITEEDYVPLPSDVLLDSTKGSSLGTETNASVAELIDKLLVRDPKHRLRSAELVSQHEWFKDIDFNLLRRQVLQITWIPPMKEEKRTKNTKTYCSYSSQSKYRFSEEEKNLFKSLDTK